MTESELMKKAEDYLAREKDPRFREDLQEVLDGKDLAELEDRFYRELDFGTGGLRGVIGGGDNRINPCNIRKATQGLADYILSQGVKTPSVVIAHDSRRYSQAFSLEAALVLAGNGIKTWLFSSLRPTPELSFAVRELGASAGIVVTASHNPPEYNGYKVYWSDGAQLVPPHDRGVIEKVRSAASIKALSKDEALAQGLLEYIGPEMDHKYAELVKSYIFRRELLVEKARELTVVYTPLHGTGTLLVERLFRELGIRCLTVPEQREPDGNFPTVEYPNPEEPAALKMAMDLAVKEKAQLVIGTDPDADRIGIGIPVEGGIHLFSGNQLGVLLGDYIFSALAEQDRLPARPALIKTIVTTEMQTLLAEKYGAKVFDVLTGFKYIGEKIREFETQGYDYVFGGEESYGFLAIKEIRDKDAVSTAVFAAEMVLYHQSRGKTLLDRLEELYEEFGYFQEILVSRTIKGAAGVEKIKEIMENLRKNPPAEVGGVKTAECLDYLEKNRMDLPKSDVFQIRLGDNTIITARPSGTEPKIKFYASVRTEAGVPPEEARRLCAGKLEKINAYIETLVGI